MINVEHPQHYGGADNLYEAIKVIEAWQLGFCLGNAVKYIARAGKKLPPSLFEQSTAVHEKIVREATVRDLEKCLWYVQHEIERLRMRPPSEAPTAPRCIHGVYFGDHCLSCEQQL